MNHGSSLVRGLDRNIIRTVKISRIPMSYSYTGRKLHI